MTEKQQAAVALFESGSVNCAQAVLCTFAPELGMDKDTLARIASGFGGGVGRLRGMCGAVSGMCMAAGALYGYDAIPTEWINTLKRRDYIEEMCKKAGAAWRG